MNVIGTWLRAYLGHRADTVYATAGCLRVRKQRIIAPLEREGFSLENCCTLNPPFGPRGTGQYRH